MCIVLRKAYCYNKQVNRKCASISYRKHIPQATDPGCMTNILSLLSLSLVVFKFFFQYFEILRKRRICTYFFNDLDELSVKVTNFINASQKQRAITTCRGNLRNNVSKHN